MDKINVRERKRKSMKDSIKVGERNIIHITIYSRCIILKLSELNFIILLYYEIIFDRTFLKHYKFLQNKFMVIKFLIINLS